MALSLFVQHRHATATVLSVDNMRLSLYLLARRSAASNFQYWNRYVDQRMQRFTRRREWHPLVGWQEKQRENWFYNEMKPWTDDFMMENLQREDKPIVPIGKPIKEWKMFVGDRVSETINIRVAKSSNVLVSETINIRVAKSSNILVSKIINIDYE